MASTKPEPKIKPIKAVGDSKFYKPGSDEQYDVEAANLTPQSNDYTALAYQTNAGNRIVFGVAEDVCRGRFTSEKAQKGKEPADPTSEEETTDSASTEAADDALVPFFEEFWGNDATQGFPKMLAEMRMQGIGFAIATLPNETSSDLVKPLTPTPGTEYRWIVPETANMFQSTTTKSPPQLSVLDWSENWKWWNLPVDKSRIEVLQFYPDENKVMGHSELEKCAPVLWGLYNLEKGTLDRISVWALLNYVFKIDPQGFKINDKAKYDAIATAMGQSNWKALESSDDLIQLADTAGHGIELMEILYTLLSTGSRIPAVILRGVQQGAVTGSETDLTQYGQYITTIQSRCTPFQRRILMKWYGIDVDDLQWNVDFFQSKKAKLEDEKLEIEVERMRTGEDIAMIKAAFAARQAESKEKAKEQPAEETKEPKGNLIEKGKVPAQ